MELDKLYSEYYFNNYHLESDKNNFDDDNISSSPSINPINIFKLFFYKNFYNSNKKKYSTTLSLEELFAYLNHSDFDEESIWEDFEPKIVDLLKKINIPQEELFYYPLFYIMNYKNRFNLSYKKQTLTIFKEFIGLDLKYIISNGNSFASKKEMKKALFEAYLFIFSYITFILLVDDKLKQIFQDKITIFKELNNFIQVNTFIQIVQNTVKYILDTQNINLNSDTICSVLSYKNKIEFLYISNNVNKAFKLLLDKPNELFYKYSLLFSHSLYKLTHKNINKNKNDEKTSLKKKKVLNLLVSLAQVKYTNKKIAFEIIDSQLSTREINLLTSREIISHPDFQHYLWKIIRANNHPKIQTEEITKLKLFQLGINLNLNELILELYRLLNTFWINFNYNKNNDEDILFFKDKILRLLNKIYKSQGKKNIRNSQMGEGLEDYISKLFIELKNINSFELAYLALNTLNTLIK